jgi:hypothetical protein
MALVAPLSINFHIGAKMVAKMVANGGKNGGKWWQMVAKNGKYY